MISGDAYFSDDILSTDPFLIFFIIYCDLISCKCTNCKCYYKNVQKVENKNVHSKDMC